MLGVAQIFALSLASFLLLSVAPGHLLSTEGLDPQRNRESVETWIRSKGLDKPWPVRYGDWLRLSLTGDLGMSLAYEFPVTQLLTARAPRTLALVVPAWLLGWILGLAAAAICVAVRQLLHIAEPAFTIAGMLPEAISGSLILWLAVSWRLPLDGVWLPLSILTVPLASVVFLHAASGFAEARQTRFVQMARARGISGWTFWRHYILYTSGVPLVSLLAPSVVAVTGSALVVEVLTGWPGIGPLFLDAFHARDFPVVQGVLLILGVLLTTLNLVADLLLYRLDPRIRLGHEDNR